MNRLNLLVKIIFIVFIYSSQIVFAEESLKTTSTLESPNKKFRFSLISDNSNQVKSDIVCNSFILFKGNKKIWQSSAGTLESMVAAWSSASDYLLFVDQDRISIKLLSTLNNRESVVKLDISTLLIKGSEIIKYNWSIPNQGSIPHDTITDLQQQCDNVFLGVYSRAKYPNKTAILFKVKLFFDGQKLNKNVIVIYKVINQKWGDKVPDVNSLCKLKIK